MPDWIDENWRAWLIFAASLVILALIEALRRRRKTGRETAPNSKAEPAPCRWAGSGSPIRAGAWPSRMTVNRALIYERVNVPSAGRCLEPSAIDPRLSLRGSAANEKPLPARPQYPDISGPQRKAYLTWLAENSLTPAQDPGFLQLYLYGIERRVLVDEEDESEIFDQLVHLLENGAGIPNKFRRDAATILWFLVAREPQQLRLNQLKSLSDATETWTEESISQALSWFAFHQEPLPRWMARHVAPLLPQAKKSVTVRRVPELTEQLFELYFTEEWGDKFHLKVAKRELKATIAPRNPSLPTSYECKCQHPLGLASQFKPLTTLWNRVMDELRRASTLVGPNSRFELTPESWLSLPPALRSRIEHPSASALRQKLAEKATPSGDTVLTVSELTTLLGGRVGRLTVPRSQELCDILEKLGSSVEPDARLTGRSYRNEQSTVLFPLPQGPAPDASRMNAAANLFHLGWSIAQADGKADPEEIRLLTDHIEKSIQLGESECRRLSALGTLISRGENSLKFVAQLKETLPPASIHSVGKLLVAMAAWDGVITSEEMKALERAFRSLGLTRKDLETLVSSLLPHEASDEEPVEAAPKPAPPSRSKPKEPKDPPAPKPFTLDRSAIADIMDESMEVGNLISAALGKQEDEDDPTVSPPENVAGFYRELIEKTAWERTEADDLARRHGKMLAGVLEVINDWAYDALGAPLLHEEEDEIIVDTELLPSGATQK